MESFKSGNVTDSSSTDSILFMQEDGNAGFGPTGWKLSGKAAPADIKESLFSGAEKNPVSEQGRLDSIWISPLKD